MSDDPILRPIRFKSGLRVKNRIFRSSISGQFDNEDGSGTQTRINWEARFAKGGVGAIISSYVPVMMRGRILPFYATIHRDQHIPFWATSASRRTSTIAASSCSSAIPGGSRTGPASPIAGARRSPRPRARNRCTAFPARR